MSAPIAVAAQVRSQLRKRLLAAHPDLIDDQTALLDTLDGLDDFNELAVALWESAHEDELMVESIKARIAELAARKSRLETRAEVKGRALLLAMQEAALPKIEAASVTLNLARVAPYVVVTDEGALDYPYRRLRHELVTDKKALAADLKAGAQIAGATMSNGGVRLNARVK